MSQYHLRATDTTAAAIPQPDPVAAATEQTAADPQIPAVNAEGDKTVAAVTVAANPEPDLVEAVTSKFALPQQPQ